MEEPRTFTETAVREAAARRTRVDLVLDPVTPDGERRLISRLVGINDDGNLILEVPKTTEGSKVFIPPGWQLGLAFELADLWMQSRSMVLGHCQFPVRPGRRVDALTVERPERILSCNQRKRARRSGHALKPVTATILPTCAHKHDRPPGPCLSATLRNWSDDGLGLQIDGPHTMEAGLVVLVRVRIPSLARSSLFTGVVKHVTTVAPGVSLVGVGEVREVPSDQGDPRVRGAACPEQPNLPPGERP